MRKDRITINKSLVPYSFRIALASEIFELVINYNEKHDFYTVSLYKGGELVCDSEPIVYGVPLFQDVYMAGYFPAIDIIPLDESGEADNVTFANLEKTVFLTVDNQGGEDIE